jgi:N-acetylglucosamine kinase-like BadF-type ATPase
LASSEAGPSNHLLVSAATAHASVSQAVSGALDAAALTIADIECVSAGMAGVDFNGAGAADVEPVFRDLGFKRTVIHSDMVAAHAGALDGRPGVLVIAGTGSAMLAVNTAGSPIKIGGWGPLFGDQGSGFAIGRDALHQAALSFDGLAPPTSLVERLVDALGCRSFFETITAVYGGRMSQRDIASLAPLVAQAAAEGDPAALGILCRAGEYLGSAAAALLRRAELAGSNALVSYQGSVLEKCEPVRRRFTECLAGKAVVEPPRHSALVGAWLLARRDIHV